MGLKRLKRNRPSFIHFTFFLLAFRRALPAEWDVCGAAKRRKERREIPSGNVISGKSFFKLKCLFIKFVPREVEAEKTARSRSIQRTHGNSLTLTFPRLNCFAGLAPFLILLSPSPKLAVWFCDDGKMRKCVSRSFFNEESEQQCGDKRPDTLELLLHFCVLPATLHPHCSRVIVWLKTLFCLLF